MNELKSKKKKKPTKKPDSGLNRKLKAQRP